MPLEDDDAFEDVRAAYAEVSGKAETPAPSSQPAETPAGTPDEVALAEQKATGRSMLAKDERGRFTKQTPEAGEGDKAATAKVEGRDENAAQPSQDKAAKPAGGPPTSWTVQSKAAWDALPEQVRADVAKRESEMNAGLAALRDYKDLKPYAELASKHGTTIGQALERYVGIERMLQQDLGQGLAHILQNYGMSQPQAGQFFAALARRYGGQAAAQPNGGAAPAEQPGQPSPDDPIYDLLKPFIEPLKNEVSTLRQSLSSRVEADRNASHQSLASAIEAFAVDPANRYFPDLEETISRLFETGMVPLSGNHASDLRTAYDTAAQMQPDVREALIEQRLREQKDAERRKEQEAADKARKASRSLTGSRLPGMMYAQPAPDANGHDDIEADVLAAYRQHAQH